MQYRFLGKTGLKVSELCLGTMTFGGKGVWQAVGQLTAKEAETLVNIAFDAGVNLFDTANVYSEGASEELLGSALISLGCPRDHYVVATKVRGTMGPGPNESGLSRGHIFSSIDASLSRLQLDYVDLYQIHGDDTDTPVEETVTALNDVVRSGKARYVGFSNLSAWKAMKALAYAEAKGFARFVSAQMYYSIAGRDIEREIVPLLKDTGLALLPWSPLAGGLLSGKYELGKPGPSGARRSSFDFPPVDKARLSRILPVLHGVAEAEGVSMARVALAWMLTKPFVTSIICGAKTTEQLKDNLSASEVRLLPEQIAELDKASELPAEYPGWMIERQSNQKGMDASGKGNDSK